MQQQGNSFWSTLKDMNIRSEADVEYRLVVPLMLALGYEESDLAPKVAVKFAQGRTGRPHEADFVAYSSSLHNRDTSLVTIEAKKPGKSLAPAKQQAESYANHLRCPFYILINGDIIEIWQMQISRESNLLLSCTLPDLVIHRGRLESTISKKAAIAWSEQLGLKVANFASFDLLPYFHSLPGPDLRDFNNPRVSRRLKSTHGKIVTTGEVLAECQRGFIVTGAGGMGKTTILYEILDHLRSMGVATQSTVLPVYMRALDAEFAGGLEAYARRRISAHLPQLDSEKSFRHWMRNERVVLLVDAVERVRAPHQIAYEIRGLLSDFRNLQICLAARRSSTEYEDMGLTLLSIQSLNETECIDIIVFHTGSPENRARYVYSQFSSRLRRQCENPFILLRVLDQFMLSHQMPKSGADALREWISRQICLPISESLVARQALSRIAWECVTGPMPISAAARVANVFGNAILDRMESDGFIFQTADGIDFQQDILVDAMIALDICDRASKEASADLLVSELGTLGSRSVDVAILVFQWSDNHHAHKALWDFVLNHSLPDYCEAVATRADASAHVAESGVWFLDELLEGLDCVFRSYLPELRANYFGLDEDSKPAIIGRATPRSLQYAVQRVPRAHPTTTLTPEAPGFEELWAGARERRFVDLGLSGVRMDGPRLVATQSIRDHLKDLIKGDRLSNNATWVKERLLAFLAWHFRGRDSSDLLEADIDSLSREFHTLRRRGVREFADGTKIRDVIADLDRARAWKWGPVGTWDHYHASLTSTPTGFDRPESEGFAIRQYHKSLTLYTNAMFGPLSRLRSYVRHFPILPLRYDLCLLRRASHFGRDVLTVFCDWAPVTDWSDVTVTCNWAEHWDDVPSVTDERVETLKSSLRALGRPTSFLSFGGSHDFDPERPTTTWAMDNARDMLLGDIDHLFKLVKTSDFVPSMDTIMARAAGGGMPILALTFHNDDADGDFDDDEDGDLDDYEDGDLDDDSNENSGES